jgi:ACS family glucarate transporter-like MFS transporter
VRWQVVAGIFLLAFITIMDRVCISSAKLGIASDLGITDVQFGWVFGVFACGYATLMIPAGWWADRIGPRVFLTAIVCCWSILTAGTGFATTLIPLLSIRFLFGLAEAGAYPTASRALYSWMATSERGLALGLLNTGSRLGAAL